MPSRIVFDAILTRRPMRLALLGLLLLLLAGAVRQAWTIDPDAAAYVGLARSLAAGEGYALFGVPHAKFPPGLPLLLAGVMRVAGPEAFAAFQLLLVGLLIAAVAASAALVRRLGWGTSASFAVAAAVGLSQTFFDLSVRYLRSEVPFLAASLLAALLTQRALAPGGRARHVVGAALLTMAAVATRLAGVTLLVVPALHLLSPADGAAGRRRAALLLAASLLAPAGWAWWGQQVREARPDAPDYRAEFLAAEPRDLTKTVPVDMPTIDGPGLLRRVAGNAAIFARACGVLLTNVDRTAEVPLAGVGLAGLVLLGLALQLGVAGRATTIGRRDAAVYVLATLGLYLLWPFNQQERFYAPLLPWLLLAAGEGAAAVLALGRRVTSRRAGRIAVVLLLALVTVGLASRRSNHPEILGRWSAAYSAVLAGLAAGTLVLAAWVRRRPLPAARAGFALLLPLAFAAPFAQERFIAWPAQVRAFEARRASQPVEGPLARVDVHPTLEALALHLREHASPDTVVMTDVPKMLQILTGVRCVPLRYRLDPPAILTEGATHLFFTRDEALPDIAAILDVSAGAYHEALRLPPVHVGEREYVPILYAVD